MKQLLMVVAMALAIGAVHTAAQQSRSSIEKRFASAEHKAKVEGDLKGALAEYSRIVTTAGGNRAAAAKALLQIAELQKSLGDSASERRTYQRLSADYADRPEAVIARERLTKTASGAGVVIRPVWTGPEVGLPSAVSPDGRVISYLDPQTGDLAVRDLMTGENRRLTHNQKPFEAQATGSVFSRDGKQIFYTWLNAAGQSEVRSIETFPASSASWHVVYANEQTESITVEDASRDGAWIALQLTRKDRTAQIGLLSTTTGKVSVLRTLDWRGSTHVAFSPDSRYVAFDLVAPGSTQRDILTLAVDGSRETTAVSDPAEDAVIGWATNGKELVFASDRSGAWGIWSIAVSGSGATPQLRKADTGRLQTLGMSSAGDLFFGVTTGGPDLHTASIDFESATLAAAPIRVVAKFTGTRSYPDWSPDGTSLSYLADRDGGRRMTLVIRSVDTGATRNFDLQLDYAQWPTWSPDGRFLVAQGRDLKNRSGIWKIDPQTGAIDAIVTNADDKEDATLPHWSPDGRSLFYCRCRRDRSTHTIVQRDLDSGAERDVFTGRNIRALSVAPNGRSLALVAYDAAEQRSVVSHVTVAGGASRELVRLSPAMISNGNAATNHNITWTRDGRFVVFHRMGERFISIIPADGGAGREIDLGDASSRGIRIHPDGHRVVFIVAKNVAREVLRVEGVEK